MANFSLIDDSGSLWAAMHMGGGGGGGFWGGNGGEVEKPPVGPNPTLTH